MVFRQIQRNRRIVAITAITMIAVIASIGVGAQFMGTGSGWPNVIAVTAALSLPSIYALVSLDRRPSLLPAAVMAAVVAAVLVLELSPVWLVAAVVWGLVVRSRPRPAPEPDWARFARPLLAAALVIPMLLLFSHVDPVCTVTYQDGRVEQIDPSTRGYSTGWSLGFNGTTSETESASNEATNVCSSNTVTWWEALLSLTATAGIVVLTLRWPSGDELARRSPSQAMADTR